MTFGTAHYVPVLKLKQGEKQAVQTLRNDVVERTVPLFEVVEMNGTKTVSAHLKTAFAGLGDAVSRVSRFFIDAREISSAGPAGARAAFAHAATLGVPFVPVTGLSRTADLAAAMSAARDGICLRVTRAELEEGDVPLSLPQFLSRNGLKMDQVDLIVDLGAVEDMIADGIGLMTQQFLALVPSPAAWRTMTVVASAFPKSMGLVETESHSDVPRAEWLSWRNHVFAERNRLARVPTYGDCGIQHPSGVEGFDPRIMQASAAVRYARPESWLLIKGRGTKRVPPSQQFPGLAQRLTSGAHRRQYMGAEHCEGCRLISAAAANMPKLGSPTTWRRIGTIHHITTTVEALKTLAST